jgi:hypothetical protein
MSFTVTTDILGLPRKRDSYPTCAISLEGSGKARGTMCSEGGSHSLVCAG